MLCVSGTADWYGKQAVTVDRFFPSSQLCCVRCSVAGYKRSFHPSVGMPPLRNDPQPGPECREKYFERPPPAGVSQKVNI